MLERASEGEATAINYVGTIDHAGKDVSFHEVSDRSRQLQFAWQKYADIVEALSKAFPEQALPASW